MWNLVKVVILVLGFASVMNAGDVIILPEGNRDIVNMEDLTRIEALTSANQTYSNENVNITVQLEQEGATKGAFCFLDEKQNVLNSLHKISSDWGLLGFIDKSNDISLLVAFGEDGRDVESIMLWENDNYHKAYTFRQDELVALDNMYLGLEGELYLENENGLFLVEGYDTERSKNMLILRPMNNSSMR